MKIASGTPVSPSSLSDELRLAAIERILHQADELNWHSPHSPLLDPSGTKRRRLMSDYVAKTEKAKLLDPQDDSPSGASRTKGR